MTEIVANTYNQTIPSSARTVRSTRGPSRKASPMAKSIHKRLARRAVSTAEVAPAIRVLQTTTPVQPMLEARDFERMVSPISG